MAMHPPACGRPAAAAAAAAALFAAVHVARGVGEAPRDSTLVLAPGGGGGEMPARMAHPLVRRVAQPGAASLDQANDPGDRVDLFSPPELADDLPGMSGFEYDGEGACMHTSLATFNLTAAKQDHTNVCSEKCWEKHAAYFGYIARRKECTCWPRVDAGCSSDESPDWARYRFIEGTNRKISNKAGSLCGKLSETLTNGSRARGCQPKGLGGRLAEYLHVKRDESDVYVANEWQMIKKFSASLSEQECLALCNKLIDYGKKRQFCCWYGQFGCWRRMESQPSIFGSGQATECDRYTDED